MAAGLMAKIEMVAPDGEVKHYIFEESEKSLVMDKIPDVFCMVTFENWGTGDFITFACTERKGKKMFVSRFRCAPGSGVLLIGDIKQKKSQYRLGIEDCH